MNAKGVPQLFIATGATKFGNPKNFPWTMGFLPTYQGEGHVYANYLIEHYLNSKIGVLYQNDDYGKDFLQGMRDGLGGKNLIVSEQAYETSDPTVSSQIITLQKSGADIFFDVTTPKFAAQAITKVAEVGWKPVHVLNSVSNSVGSVLKPAGLENGKGIPQPPSSRTRPIRHGRTIPVLFYGPSLWTNIFQTEIALLVLRPRATRQHKQWCKYSGSAGMKYAGKIS